MIFPQIIVFHNVSNVSIGMSEQDIWTNFVIGSGQHKPFVMQLSVFLKVMSP